MRVLLNRINTNNTNNKTDFITKYVTLTEHVITCNFHVILVLLLLVVEVINNKVMTVFHAL